MEVRVGEVRKSRRSVQGVVRVRGGGWGRQDAHTNDGAKKAHF